MFSSLYGLQVRGWGEGCGVHLCAGSVSAQSVQRAQYLQQSDDPVLQAFDQGEVSLHAGPASLHLALLLRHARWWSVYTLGLEGLTLPEVFKYKHSVCVHVLSCRSADLWWRCGLYVVCSWMHFGFVMQADGWAKSKAKIICKGSLCWLVQCNGFVYFICDYFICSLRL